MDVCHPGNQSLLELLPFFFSIANHTAMQNPFKRKKIEQIAMMLQAVLNAEGKAGIMMNVKKSDLPNLLEKLPALQRPTVSELSDPNWVALNTIVTEQVLRDLIPELKELGATGIIEYPLNKLVD